MVRQRRRPLKSDHERALALLADSPEGVPEPVMTVAHGFTIGQLVELVEAGLATKDVRRMRGRNTVPIAVTWVKITDAGLAARLRQDPPITRGAGVNGVQDGSLSIEGRGVLPSSSACGERRPKRTSAQTCRSMGKDDR